MEWIGSKRAPWDQGHPVAKQLHDQLGLGAFPLNSVSSLAKASGIPNLHGITLADLYEAYLA